MVSYSLSGVLLKSAAAAAVGSAAIGTARDSTSLRPSEQNHYMQAGEIVYSLLSALSLMSGTKRQREASTGNSKGLLQESLQVVINALSKMSWRTADNVAKAGDKEAEVGSSRWEAAPSSLNVAAWVLKEDKMVRGVWDKMQIIGNLPVTFQKRMRILRREDFPAEYADDVKNGEVWLHLTTALPSESVFDALGYAVANNLDGLHYYLGMQRESSLGQIACFGKDYEIPALVTGCQHLLEPAQKKARIDSAFFSQVSGAKESAGEVGPANANIERKHLEVPDSEVTVNKGLPYPPTAPIVPNATKTKYIVVRISDGCRVDAWRTAVDVANRAGFKVYTYDNDDMAALMDKLGINPQQPNPNPYQFIPEGKEKEHYESAKQHIIAEAKKLGLQNLKIQTIAARKNDSLSVLVKTGAVKTYLSGTNDLLFTPVEELDAALATSSVDADLKTSPVVQTPRIMTGQTVFEVMGGTGYSVAPRLAFSGDLHAKCTLAFAIMMEVNGVKVPAIAVYEDVSPRLTMKVAFAWQTKVDAFIETDDDAVFGDDLIEAWRILKSRCQPVSRKLVEELLRYQDEQEAEC